jgi:hypothetical protein
MVLEFGILVLVNTTGLVRVAEDTSRLVASERFILYGGFSLLIYMLIYVICYRKYGILDVMVIGYIS